MITFNKEQMDNFRSAFDSKSWAGAIMTATTGWAGTNKPFLSFLQIHFRMPTVSEMQYACLCVSFMVGIVTFGYTVHKWILLRKTKN